MKLKSHQIITNNAPLKALSLIAGYTFWHVFSALSSKSIWLTVPLCFFTTNTDKIIEGPENIKVHLTGRRTHIYSLNKKTLAAHINGDKLTPGKHPLTITADSLFLPESIKLVHYIPSNTHVTVKNNKKNNIS